MMKRPNDGAVPSGNGAGQDDAAGPHALETPWVMWYDHRKTVHRSPNPTGAANQWEDCLVQLSEFSTVEDFWSTYNHIKRPSALEFGANYHMFRKGVKPAWEDAANVNGGKWVITLGAKDDAAKLDKAWELLLLSLVGEYLYDGLEDFEGVDKCVSGIVVSRRRANTRIAVWTSDATKEAMLLALGRRLKDIAQSSDATLEFSAHNTETSNRMALKL